MSRVILLLLVVLAVFSASSFGQEDCGENAEFAQCGSRCEPSCQTPRVKMCTFDCFIGCRCKDGFLRNSAGACVPPEAC